MHVKRHLSRLFGSFRRKDSKNFSEKVLNQLQSRANQTASRWELLDYDQDDLSGTQFPQSQPDKTINPILSSTKLKSQTLEKKETGSGSSSPVSYHEVQVELSSQNSFRSKWKRRSFLKKQNDYKEHKPISEQDETFFIPSDLNVKSVVQQINDTISLINEFQPETPKQEVGIPSQGTKTSGETATLPLWPTDETDSLFSTTASFSNTSGFLSPIPSRNNPDLISKVEEGTRLTRGIWAQPMEKEIVNLTQNNEEMRANSVSSPSSLFVPDDPSAIIATFSDRNGTLPRESSFNIRRSSFSSASRPGAEAGAGVSGSGSSSKKRIQNPARRLSYKIHKRFSRKSPSSSSEENTTTTTTSYPKSSPAFFEEGNENKREIKSIVGGDDSTTKDDDWDGKMLKRNLRERASTGRLFRSFRKAVSFPRSTFKALDTNQIEQEIGEVATSDKTRGNKNVVTEWREMEGGGGMVKVKRKLSMKALQTPGKGMRNILKKGVTAFGKSMIHASAVIPTPYECPPNYSNYNPDDYWEEEDYVYEFRRYCQSAELEYQNRLSQIKSKSKQNQQVQGTYQHGYCA